MTRRSAVPWLIAGLAACNNAVPGAGLYFFTPGPVTTESNDVSLEENFVDAAPFDAQTQTPDFTTVANQSESDGSVFVEILDGYKDDVYVILQDEFVLTGVRNELGDLVVGWSGVSESDEVSEHDDGYIRSANETAQADVTLTLIFDPETSSFSGDLVQTWSSTSESTEQDVGVNEDIFFLWGWINNVTLSNLENLNDGETEPDGRFNTPDEAECTDANCRVQITRAGRYTRPMTGWPVQGDGALAGEYGGIGNPPGGTFTIPLLHEAMR